MGQGYPVYPQFCIMALKKRKSHAERCCCYAIIWRRQNTFLENQNNLETPDEYMKDKTSR